MNAEEEFQLPLNPEVDHPATIGARADYCMLHYQPYRRKDFNLHQFSVITNIPASNLETWFDQTGRPFDRYLDEWRVKYAKMLITNGKVRNMEIGTIGSLSGFSSARKFTAAYTQIEGISPETYQFQINISKSL